MTADNNPKTVFLSSTTKDLLAYRDAAEKAVKSMGHHCVRMEDFTVDHQTPADYCREQIGNCDVFVGLLGPCYGSSPKGTEISFTELEFEVAQELSKPCLMLLSAEDFPVPANLLIEDGRWQDQKAFRHKVSERVTVNFFTTPDDLRAKIVAAFPKIRASGPPDVDCIVLCGGSGSRLWPLTLDFCKVLLPVAGKPVLSYVLDFIRDCSSVRRTYLLTNREFQEDIRAFLTRVGTEDAEVIAEPVSDSGGNLGPIGALHYAVNLQGPRDVVVLGGDNVFSFALDEFLRFAARKGTSANALYRFETGSDVSQYGVATLDSDETVSEFTEKQEIPAFLNISTACYFLREEEVDSLPKYLKGGGDPYSLGSFMHWLVVSGVPLAGHLTTEPWFDVGTRRKLLDANRHFLVDSRRGRHDSETHIKGPAQIAKEAVLESARVGPHVYVGPGASVGNSTVRDSIIMEGAVVRDGHVSESIIGSGSTVEGIVSQAVVGRGAQMLAESPETPRMFQRDTSE